MSRPRKVAKPAKVLCDAKDERIRKKHLALGQQGVVGATGKTIAQHNARDHQHGVNSAAFRQHIHRTQDRIASEAAFPLLSEGLTRFKMHAPGFKLAKGGLRTADPLPTTRDAMIRYVNKLQDEIEKLREKVGEARYQLTGSTGT